MTMHVAHRNIARLRALPGDPLVAEFLDTVPRVNALAERSPGFVWRFEPMDKPTCVVRPVAEGTRPTVADGQACLAVLAATGPTDAAHDFSYIRTAE